MSQRASTRERLLGALICGVLAAGTSAALLGEEEVGRDVRPSPVIAQPLAPPGSLPTEAPDPTKPLAEQVLPNIKYPLDQLGYRVVFEAANAEAVGEANPLTKVITIYVQPGWDLRTLTLVTAHEVGHAAALEYMDEERQREWMSQRSITGSPWYACEGCSERSAGVGDYADVFTLAVAGEGNYTSTLADPPSQEVLAALTRFFYPEGAETPQELSS